MPVLEEIAAFLVYKGVGVLPANYPSGGLIPIIVGQMPEQPDACCALQDYGGNPPEQGFGVDGIHYEYPGVQLVFRGAAEDYATPRTNAKTAWGFLTKVIAPGNLPGTTTEYLMITAVNSPFQLKRDGAQRVYIAFNIICEKVPS